MIKTKIKEDNLKVKEDKLKEKTLKKTVEKESLQTEETQQEILKKSSKKPLATEKKSKKEIEYNSKQVQVSPSEDIERKKKKILEKVKKLKEKVETTDTKSLKEEVKGKKRTDMLIPLEEYVKTGIYLGTRVVTPNMKPYVYRRRADGLAIFNTDLIDQKLKESIEYLSKFNAKDIILVCKRQAGWKTAKKFEEYVTK